MNNESIDDAFLREFLLGKVNDEERVRIEDLFLTDPQAKDRVLGGGHVMEEEYLEGTLTTADRERFVSRYAQTPEQRRRLRITKSIKDWAIAEAASSAPRKTSGWRGLFGLRPAFAIPIAATAMIVIVVAAIWVSRRAGHSAIEQELAQLNAPSSVREEPVSLELAPVTVRGADSKASFNRQLSENEVVELRLLWIQKERFPSYQATIRRVGDNQSYTVGNLKPENDGKAIRLKLPAPLLSKGTYQINLSASDGSADSAEEYQFTMDT